MSFKNKFMSLALVSTLATFFGFGNNNQAYAKDDNQLAPVNNVCRHTTDRSKFHTNQVKRWRSNNRTARKSRVFNIKRAKGK